MVSYKCSIATSSLRYLTCNYLETWKNLETRVRDHWSSSDPATYDFLLTFHSNNGPISYLFRDKRRYQSKIVNSSHPHAFCVLAEEVSVPLQIGHGRSESKKISMMGLPDREWSLKISSVVWIQYTKVTDGQTDGETDRHRTTAKTALTHSVAR